jgi:hypothetical protein
MLSATTQRVLSFNGLRRSTQWHQSATRSIVAPMPSRNQVARVAVDDETWRAFRQAALARDITVAAYLGKLVESELRRRKDSPLAVADAEQPEADQAIAALAAVRLAIDELDDIAGRLARSAVAHGAAWEDVGSSLRLSADAARSAYAERAQDEP